MLDCRRTTYDGVSSVCRRVLGPSLIFQNDASFSIDDWQSIQCMFESSKADDCTAIGRFGMGSRAYFHMTDTLWIASGKKVGFLDPDWIASPQGGELIDHKRKGRGKLDLSQPASLAQLTSESALNGVFGFESGTDYPHTIFRCPLRTGKFARESTFAPYEYSVAKAWKLVLAFGRELEENLLFLQSISAIELWRWDEDEEAPFCAQVTRINGVVPFCHDEGDEEEGRLTPQASVALPTAFITPYPIRNSTMASFLQDINQTDAKDRHNVLISVCASNGALPLQNIRVEMASFFADQDDSGGTMIDTRMTVASYLEKIETARVHGRPWCSASGGAFLPQLRDASLVSGGDEDFGGSGWHPHCLPPYMGADRVSGVSVSCYLQSMELALDPRMVKIMKKLSRHSVVPIPIVGVCALEPVSLRHLYVKEASSEVPSNLRHPCFVGGSIPVEVNKGHSKGRGSMVFCHLPLPEVVSGLPVHVHGSFILTDNRRTLWTGTDTDGLSDLWAEWNRALIAKMAKSYVRILEEIEDESSDFWPDTAAVSVLFRPLMCELASMVVDKPTLIEPYAPDEEQGSRLMRLCPRDVIILDCDGSDESMLVSIREAAISAIPEKEIETRYLEGAFSPDSHLSLPFHKCPIVRKLCRLASEGTGISSPHIVCVPHHVESLLILYDEMTAEESPSKYRFESISVVKVFKSILLPRWNRMSLLRLDETALMPSLMLWFTHLSGKLGTSFCKKIKSLVDNLKFIPTNVAPPSVHIKGCRECGECQQDSCSCTKSRKLSTNKLYSAKDLYDPAMSAFRITAYHLPHHSYSSNEAIRVLKLWGLWVIVSQDWPKR
eukprot:GHVH01016717.1.p1 GENE.GHVH01016717.1~~GHVH01016717.1.p1  ORF type:complete len:836 (+),score=122.42 GHVH01016717.1:748-3255(+)